MSNKEEPFVTYEYQIENLKRYLKPIRIAFGVTSNELAAILGISRITYMKYENGQKEMTPIMYLAIRGALHDIAERVEAFECHEKLWFFFIEGFYTAKGLAAIKTPIFYEKSHDITDNIEAYILDYAKHHKRNPMWQNGIELRQILIKDYSEIF